MLAIFLQNRAGLWIVTINTETCEALGLDLDTVKEAFKPYCTEIVKVTTAENFS